MSIRGLNPICFGKRIEIPVGKKIDIVPSRVDAFIESQLCFDIERMLHPESPEYQLLKQRQINIIKIFKKLRFPNVDSQTGKTLNREI